MKLTKPYALAIVLILGVVAIFTSITGSREGEKPSSIERGEPVRVGYIPIADCAQLYVAQEKGFFDQNGITIEFVKLSGGAKIIEALIGGSVDVAFSNVVSVMLAKDAGIPIEPIVGGPRVDLNHIETALLVRLDSGIRNVAQLEGKKIAVNTKKNIVELFLKEYLKKNGVDYSSIQIVEVPFPQMYQFLYSGRVDAVATIEPFVTFSSEAGGVFNLGDYITSVFPSVEISTYNSLDAWKETSPDLEKRFKEAIVAATAYINTNPDTLPEIVAKYTSLEMDQASRVQYPTFGTSIDRDSFINVMNMVLAEGWIQSSSSIDQFLD